MPNEIQNEGIYRNLMQQIGKISSHVNQGSIETRFRYGEAVDRFCQFISDEFRVQKFTNVKEKHVVEYVKHMQGKGLSASTIKTDLSAIRFYYDQAGGKNELPTNKDLGGALGQQLERRSFGQVPRAWTDSELRAAIDKAQSMGNWKVARALELARTLGLRIHETTRLTVPQLRQALDKGFLTVKGKGGLVREVPVTPTAKEVIEKTLSNTTNSRVFVGPTEKTHQVIKHIENWIYKYRDHFHQGTVKLTYHGLRHAYAQERYERYLKKHSGDERRARLAVSIELGHGRDSVTRIYLAK